jgi:addiction module HigA family antidote
VQNPEYLRRWLFLHKATIIVKLTKEKMEHMTPENRLPTHPSKILSEEFLKPLRLSQVALAQHIGVPVQRINEIVRGKRGITPETAWLFSQAFGTSPEFWVNLQTNYDLARTRPKERYIRFLQSPL